MSKLVVGVHFPKSSGTSLKAALERHFGDTLQLDYKDGPTFPDGQRQTDPAAYMQRRDTVEPGKGIVFGHFHPAKYSHLDARRFTILRHPIDVLISIYFYWRQSSISSTLHRQVVESGMSIREMAELPPLRWLMSRSYFENVDMAQFEVIGRYEDRERALGAVCKVLNMPIFEDHENRTPDSDDQREAKSDPKLRTHLTDILADDIAFYERWAR